MEACPKPGKPFVQVLHIGLASFALSVENELGDQVGELIRNSHVQGPTEQASVPKFNRVV